MSEKYMGSIIVVDDDPYVLKSISLLLTKRGFNIIGCSNADEAISRLQKNKIDVVLTDIMMPDISGIELLEIIHKTNPDIPVILITGFADLDKAIEAIKKGAFDFITKPYESDYLIHSIKKAINYYRLLKMEADYKQILEELNSEVETLISERTMGLMAMAVADKIRNPAITIALACKRMIAKEEVPDKLQEGLRIIISEAERLEMIVKEFQELFKASETRFKYGDIKGIVEDVFSVAQKEAYHRGIDLDVNISEESLMMNMDDNLLRMALLHIVRNAIESSIIGGKVTIRAYGEREKVIFEVSDTSAEIPKEEMERIFEPFYSTKKHRFGMGLSLVKQIVTEHMGEIKLESEERKGTTLRLIFPIRWMERIV